MSAVKIPEPQTPSSSLEALERADDFTLGIYVGGADDEKLCETLRALIADARSLRNAWNIQMEARA